MKRIPVLSTILVTLAVAAMIGLGLWQLLDRLPRKEAFLAQLAGNPDKPPIAFPNGGDDTVLFRRASASCAQVTGIRKAGAGKAGFRLIAECRPQTGGADIAVQLGTTRDPGARVLWRGGAVSGYVSHAPDGRSLIGSLFDPSPQRMLLVMDPPAAGLSANARPDIASVPNSHLAYAGQWFFFAAIAATIYVLALRRRRTVVPDAPHR